ncbi:MAG TPA: hypothetical protein VEX68_15705 [Bryobacteraceae bacterium]|nr:hypothetical protein [Bryobacteraceae bacterium]
MMSLCLLTTVCSGADYYFNSKTGNDTSGSGAITAPWQTISKMNSQKYLAGDRIFLSGDAFSGPINVPTHQWGGAASKPITITSYGGAPAKITTSITNGVCINLENLNGVVIANLKCVGPGSTWSTGSGVAFLANTTRNHNLIIKDLEITGFKIPINVICWPSATGLTGLTIQDNNLHSNVMGIMIWGEDLDALREVSIVRNYVHDNTGRATGGATDPASLGTGIVAQSVIGARITHNKVKNNGALADQSAGSVGIMLYNGSDIIAEYNEVSGQTNASGNDADGFNLAGGCIRCIIQYNYSHDNKGAGYLIDGQANGTRAAQNAIVRFNISENDARGTATRAGIYVYNNGTVASQLQDWYIHNNTVFMSPGSNRTYPAACIVVGDSLQPSGGPLSGGKIFNNICYVSSGAVVMVDCKSNASNTVFANNLFYSASGAAPVLWNKCTNSGNIIGSNPLLSAAGSMGEVSTIAPMSVATRSNYQISSASSPAYNAGRDPQAIYDLPWPAHDFYGNPVRNAGRAIDIGAHELQQ